MSNKKELKQKYVLKTYMHEYEYQTLEALIERSRVLDKLGIKHKISVKFI